MTRWPASSPPTIRTLSKSGPSLGRAGSIGRSASSVRSPADAIGSEPGSSGSPVFNLDWELVALHHLGDPAYDHPPAYNQGVPIDKIRARTMMNR